MLGYMTTMEDSTIPPVFLPRSCQSGITYPSLKSHIFTNIEKLWVCEYLVNISNDVSTDLVPNIRSFCTRFDLSSKDIVQWLEAYGNREDFEEDLQPLDHIAIGIIQKAVFQGRLCEETEEQYQARLMDVLNIELHDTIARR